MAFVNEYIPEADFKKYDFERLNKRPRKAGTAPSDAWTIDRDADVWLRKFYTEMDHTDLQGGFTGISVWDFWWKGKLIAVTLESIETGGGVGKHCWSRKRLVALEIPAAMEAQRAQIVKDLEAALTAYKDGGVLSGATTYSLTLDV